MSASETSPSRTPPARPTPSPSPTPGSLKPVKPRRGRKPRALVESRLRLSQPPMQKRHQRPPLPQDPRIRPRSHVRKLETGRRASRRRVSNAFSAKQATIGIGGRFPLQDLRYETRRPRWACSPPGITSSSSITTPVKSRGLLRWVLLLILSQVQRERAPQFPDVVK